MGEAEYKAIRILNRLDKVSLLRQDSPSAPREDRGLRNDISMGADVFDTLAFAAPGAHVSTCTSE